MATGNRDNPTQPPDKKELKDFKKEIDSLHEIVRELDKNLDNLKNSKKPITGKRRK